MENLKHEEWNQRPIQQDNKKIAAGLCYSLGPLEFINLFRLYIRRDNMVINQCFTCGILTSLLGLIGGIIYLTKSDEEFYQTYQVGKKALF
jgi:hypothetical protein